MWSPRDQIDALAAFADHIKRRHGVAPAIPAVGTGAGRSASTPPTQEQVAAALADTAVEVAYLELAYTWHEGAGTDWAAKLAVRDKAAGRVWRPAVMVPADGGGAAAAGSGAAFYGAVEEHKAPLQYCHSYRRRGLFATGLLRCIRNIAAAHAHDYVADGTFASVAALHRYFLEAFPWLSLEVWRLQQSQRRGVVA